MQISKVADGGGTPEFGRREEEEGRKGKKEKGPRALFIEERVKRQARESRSLKTAE